MYLIDTNVISEARKGAKADAGVRAFFREADEGDHPLFLSAVTIGALRRGVELIRHRGDLDQAQRLEHWLATILGDYASRILNLDAEVAQVWGRLRVPQRREHSRTGSWRGALWSRRQCARPCPEARSQRGFASDRPARNRLVTKLQLRYPSLGSSSFPKRRR